MATSLQDLYADLLSMCSVDTSTYGRLVVKTKDAEDGVLTEIPLQYAGKPIIFPEKQYINDPENKDLGTITLHPLSESTLRGTSEVLDILRKAAIIRLCYVGDHLLKRAVDINHNATMDSSVKLNHKLSTLFAEVPAVDVKFVSWFNKLMNETATDSSKRLFNIYFKHEGEIGKNRFTRVCIISSPLFDELAMAGDSKVIFGVEAPRKKDLQVLMAIMNALFPKLQSNGYMEGSSSSVAPTLMAFMEALSNIGKSFNKTLEVLGKEAKGIEDGNTKGIDWDRDANLTHLRNVHPIEEFNIGVSKDATITDKETDINSRSAKRVQETLAIPARESEPTPARTEYRPSEPKPAEAEASGGFWNRRETNEGYVSQRDRDTNGDSRYDNRELSRGSNYNSNSNNRYGGSNSRYGGGGGNDNRYSGSNSNARYGGSNDRYSDRQYNDNRYGGGNNEPTTSGFWNRR